MGCKKMHKVNSCCCGKRSLRSGTLMILISSLVFGILALFVIILVPSCPSSSIIIPIIFVCISASGIYAVLKEKPQWLGPSMAMLVIFWMFFHMLCLAILILDEDAVRMWIQRICNVEISADDLTSRRIDEVDLVLGAVGGLCYYFFIVVRSYYKKLLSGSQTEP